MAILDEIPGLKKAVAKARAKEDFWRDLAFLDVNVTLCGVEVRQFSLRHYSILSLARSPFLCGGPVLASHVAGFLWTVSPGYAPADRKARAKFVCSIRNKRMERCLREIGDYLEFAFMDRPVSEVDGSPATTGTAAWIVDELRQAHGFSLEETMDMPLGRIFQLIRCISRRRNPDRDLPNRLSENVEKRYIRRDCERQAKAAQRRKRPSPPSPKRKAP